MNTTEPLPEEILIQIFSSLGQQDLVNVLLVCRRWKEVAELPWLWTKEEVVLGQKQVNNIAVLRTRRLERVKRVRVLPRYQLKEEEAEDLFQEILDHESINN